jgi:oxygen-independent coproporphyrinogen-3 oxidase
MQADFDAELIQRYNINGPRYTSYPTANLFTDAFTGEDYKNALRHLPADRSLPLSLYIHLPFCDTVCYYCACNKIITNNRKHAVEYLERLQVEIARVAAALPDNHHVEQLHFGGGTPTYFDDAQFATIFAALNTHFCLESAAVPAGQRDFSIEIDPRTVDAGRIKTLTEFGINRVSLGVQDFNPAVQVAVNRVQSIENTAMAIDAARANGVESVSIDLIYGLPLQTPETFGETLTTAVRLAPDRISLYNYAHLPKRFKTQRQIHLIDLPTAQTKLELLQLAVETFMNAGYHYIGMDHFARSGDPLVQAQREGSLQRNFQGYTTHGHCQLVGLGVSAISSIGQVYAQNAKDLPSYYELIDAGGLPTERGFTMSAEDIVRRDLVGCLMCDFYLDIPAFEARHGLSFSSHFAGELRALGPMAHDGLVNLTPERIEVTPRGRFLVRNICMVFDAYLEVAQGGFSKAI